MFYRQLVKILSSPDAGRWGAAPRKSMPPTPMDFGDVPNSAYTKEIQRNSRTLHFLPPLEAEYRQWHVQRYRFRARIWLLLVTLITSLVTIRNLRADGLHTLLSLAQPGLLVPTTLVLAWLPWSAAYERHYLSVARILIPIISAFIAFQVAQAVSQGQSNSFVGLPIQVLAVFFLSGLLIFESAAIAAAVLCVYAGTAAAFSMSGAGMSENLIILLLTIALGAIAQFDVEKSQRESFLERGLIGELVTRDSLTALKNRRAFNEHLLRVWQHAQRDTCTISILMIDIDHFKQYNDSFGHQAGDHALRYVANIIQAFARRPLDMAARLGGEEFVILLYDLPIAHVADIAERLRLSVKSLNLDSPNAASLPQRPITVSIGVAVALPSVGRSPQGAIQLADEALYQAKGAGRDCTIVKGARDYNSLDTGAFSHPGVTQRQA